MRTTIRSLFKALAAVLAVCTAGALQAQAPAAWPTKPVRIVASGANHAGISQPAGA